MTANNTNYNRPLDKGIHLSCSQGRHRYPGTRLIPARPSEMTGAAPISVRVTERLWEVANLALAV